MLGYQGSAINFNEINCPTLLMRGAQDRSINIPKQEKMLQDIPRAKLTVIPDASPLCPYRKSRINSISN